MGGETPESESVKTPTPVRASSRDVASTATTRAGDSTMGRHASQKSQAPKTEAAAGTVGEGYLPLRLGDHSGCAQELELSDRRSTSSRSWLRASLATVAGLVHHGAGLLGEALLDVVEHGVDAVLDRLEALLDGLDPLGRSGAGAAVPLASTCLRSSWRWTWAFWKAMTPRPMLT